MTAYIISITARDRSGIVAGVSRGLVGMRGNIEAASQTVHQGYFAMILLVGFAQEVDPQEVSAQIKGTAGADLHVYATAYQPPAAKTAPPSHAFIITSIGPDKPGILCKLTSYLADRQVNIDDLYCVVDQGNFVVICQVSVPLSFDVFMLQTDLEAVGKEGGFTVQMQHENIFEVTNHP